MDHLTVFKASPGPKYCCKREGPTHAAPAKFSCAPGEIESDKVISLGAVLSRFRPHFPLPLPPSQPGSNIVLLHQSITDLLQSLLPPLHTIRLQSSLNP